MQSMARPPSFPSVLKDLNLHRVKGITPEFSRRLCLFFLSNKHSCVPVLVLASLHIPLQHPDVFSYLQPLHVNNTPDTRRDGFHITVEEQHE